jgi:hypothetical protein
MVWEMERCRQRRWRQCEATMRAASCALSPSHDNYARPRPALSSPLTLRAAVHLRDAPLQRLPPARHQAPMVWWCWEASSDVGAGKLGGGSSGAGEIDGGGGSSRAGEIARGDWERRLGFAGRGRAGGLFSDPWIKRGSARGPRALDGTADRDRATSARSDG